MTRVGFAAALFAVLALAGCGSVPAADPVSIASIPATAAEVAVPVAVRIPSIGVVSPPLVQLDLDTAGVLTVPPLDQPQLAGWFGVRPGQVGPSVVAAHVSGRVDAVSVPGLFARLAELGEGDAVLVDHADGTATVWRVTAVEQHDKDAFPTEAVYGDEDQPVLHLITCGGTFDPAARSYRDNVVVHAVLA